MAGAGVGGARMSSLRGRPERQDASGAGPRGPSKALSDNDVVKVTTRLTNGQARRMRVAAMQQGIAIEDAYSDAVDAYLRGR